MTAANAWRGSPSVYDLMGKDTTLFHHATNDDDASTGSLYVAQLQTWFETIWTTVARPAVTA